MLTQRQIDEIYAKKPESRYRYFIKTIAEEEEVWGLADDEGWLMIEDLDDNTDVMPVFPKAEFVDIFRERAGFQEYKTEVLDLYEFVDWLDDFALENIKVAVFPTPDFHGAVLPPDRIKEDIQAEFDKELHDE